MKRISNLLVLIFCGFIAVVGFVFEVMVVIFFLVYFYPKPAWEIVSRRFLPADLSVSVRDIHIWVRPVSWKKWKIDTGFDGLKIDKASPAIHLPAERLHISATLRLFSPSWSILIHDATVTAMDIISYQGKGESASAQIDYQQQFSRLIQYLKFVRDKIVFEHMAIDITDVHYDTDHAMSVRMGVSIHKRTGESVKVALTVRNISRQVERLDVKGSVDVGGEHGGQFGRFALTTKGERIFARSVVRLRYRKQRAIADVDSYILYRYKTKPIVLSPAVHIELDDRALGVKFDVSLRGRPISIVRLHNIYGELNIPLPTKDQDDVPSTFLVRLPIELYFLDRNLRPPIEKSCQCRIPEEILAEFSGRAWPQALTDRANFSHDLLDGHLSINSVKNRLVDVTLGADLKVRKQSGQWRIEPIMKSLLVIHSFQGLRNYLDAKNLLIPAPFDVLDGEIELRAKAPVQIGDMNDMESTLSTACELKVNLTSAHQKVSLKSNAVITANDSFRHINIDVKSTIDKLELQLPPFQPIAGVPKIFRDSRIQLRPGKESSEKRFNMMLSFAVETAGPGAVKLFSSLARPYIPLEFQLTKQKAGVPDGTIRIEPFEIVYLRRTVAVDSLQLGLTENPDHDYPITGDFHVDQTNYKVKIHISGTSKDPQILLSSDPYLDHNDIISVLLYDRTTNELDSGDAETSGNVQAALADHAMGLLGLWLFAATPIRSFTYNPMTKVYSATIAVGHGVSVGVGTDWEQSTMLEARKRISRRWVVMASWSPSQEDPDREVGKLTLQWERRF